MSASKNILQVAQEAKYQRMYDELSIGPGASLLEIGCGWGGFAEKAAKNGAPFSQ